MASIVTTLSLRLSKMNSKTLLYSIRSGRGIMIDYIVRDGPDLSSPMEDVEVPNNDSNDIITKRPSFRGPGFQRKNARAYTILRTILTNATA